MENGDDGRDNKCRSSGAKRVFQCVEFGALLACRTTLNNSSSHSVWNSVMVVMSTALGEIVLPIPGLEDDDAPVAIAIYDAGADLDIAHTYEAKRRGRRLRAACLWVAARRLACGCGTNIKN